MGIVNSNIMIQNFPDHVHPLPRRSFIKRLFGTAAFTAVLPHYNCGERKPTLDLLNKSVEMLSDSDVGDEHFWQKVKAQFPIRKNLIMMNAANLCPSSAPVQKSLFKWTMDEDGDPSFANREKFKAMKEQTRRGLAEYLGAHHDEIVITRNTSESNNVVINGLTLRETDEVLLWDQNHPTNNIAWDVHAARFGFSVKRLVTPAFPKSETQLLNLFRDACSKNTKILAFSHVSNISGIALPARELCQMARENGILTLIDGAQTFGAHVVNMEALGCDFYTGSAHKWLCGPKETGILYVRREHIERLYPSIVGAGWEPAMTIGKKFESFGQRDDARITALGKAVEFSTLIGSRRIEERIRRLAKAIKSELRKKIPNVSFHTPLEQELSGGVVVFSAPGIDLDHALDTLYRKHNLGCAVFAGEFSGIRLTPNIYNSMLEVNKAVAAVKSLT